MMVLEFTESSWVKVLQIINHHIFDCLREGEWRYYLGFTNSRRRQLYAHSDVIFPRTHSSIQGGWFEIYWLLFDSVLLCFFIVNLLYLFGITKLCQKLFILCWWCSSLFACYCSCFHKQVQVRIWTLYWLTLRLFISFERLKICIWPRTEQLSAGPWWELPRLSRSTDVQLCSWTVVMHARMNLSDKNYCYLESLYLI